MNLFALPLSAPSLSRSFSVEVRDPPPPVYEAPENGVFKATGKHDHGDMVEVTGDGWEEEVKDWLLEQVDKLD